MARPTLPVRILAGVLCGTGLLLPADLLAQGNSLEVQGISVEANLPPDGFVNRDAIIELHVSGALQPGQRIAVFLGSTDATNVFQRVGNTLRYAPRVAQLPAGERDMTVYLVHPNGEWDELRSIPLRVRSPVGYDRAQLAPGLDIGLEGQLAEGHDAESPPPPRRTYQDLTGQLALESNVDRGPNRWTTQASVIGVSRQENALRFGQLGDGAPRVDLSNYIVRLMRGPQELSLGHVSLGNQRHLVSGFSSRGAALSLKPASRVDLKGGLMNGSSVVGWYNPFGLNDPDHRVLAGSVGFEALPNPGALRLEVSGLTGSVLPLAGYNQGAVNDAEESRGLGLRLTASDPSQRLRFESGYARSRFENPNDAELSQDGSLVPVRPVTRNAHYADASLDVLRNVLLGTHPVGLSVGYRRDRVDPLYRSLGAYAQADRESNQYEVRAQIIGIGLLGSHERSGDNLDNIASVLTTLTRRTAVSADIPLGAVIGAGSIWIPVLSYGIDRTHQFGEGVPDNGEFAESHVPDQVSRNRTLSASWQLARIALGYRWNNSFQDNRQVGRERADFDARTNSINIGFNPLRRLTLDGSFDLDRAENLEREEVERTRRYGGRANIRVFGQSTLAVSASHTRSADGAQLRLRRDTLLNGHWSSVVPGLNRLGARYYLRWSRNSGRVLDREFDLDRSHSRWSLTSGLNMGITPFR